MSIFSKPSIPASPIALSLACLMLAGCNQSRFPDFTTTGSVFGASKDTAYAHALAERRPVQEAMVVMPLRAGAPLEVIQSRAGNGLKQRIVLKGDAVSAGQNTIDVRMVVKRVWPKPRKNGMKTHGGSLAAIKAQMREALPGVTMRMSNEVNTNAYGPFGYALGRAAGNVRCLFGWQNVAGKGREPWGIFTKVSERPELSVRVRICRADMNSEQLVAVLRRMRIDADPSRLKTEQGVAWRAGESTDIHSFGGSSPQGYLSQKPAASYQPQGVPAAPAQPAKKRLRKKPVTKRKARTTARRSNTARRRAVAAAPNVVLPTPQQVDVAESLPTKPRSVTTPVIASVPAIQPKTSLITLPRHTATPTVSVTGKTAAPLATATVRGPKQTAVIYNAPAQTAPVALPVPKSGKLVLPQPN
ncbi:MAG: cellulose biosynthesis protein BcsN [Pseudomonadota bacterium]